MESSMSERCIVIQAVDVAHAGRLRRVLTLPTAIDQALVLSWVLGWWYRMPVMEKKPTRRNCKWKRKATIQRIKRKTRTNKVRTSAYWITDMLRPEGRRRNEKGCVKESKERMAQPNLDYVLPCDSGIAIGACSCVSCNMSACQCSSGACVIREKVLGGRDITLFIVILQGQLTTSSSYFLFSALIRIGSHRHCLAYILCTLIIHSTLKLDHYIFIYYIKSIHMRSTKCAGFLPFDCNDVIQVFFAKVWSCIASGVIVLLLIRSGMC